MMVLSGWTEKEKKRKKVQIRLRTAILPPAYHKNNSLCPVEKRSTESRASTCCRTTDERCPTIGGRSLHPRGCWRLGQGQRNCPPLWCQGLVGHWDYQSTAPDEVTAPCSKWYSVLECITFNSPFVLFKVNLHKVPEQTLPPTQK